MVRMVRRRGRGRGRCLRSGRQDDRPHHTARALRQHLFRRPQAQPSLHGGEPVNLFTLRRDAGPRRWLIAAVIARAVATKQSRRDCFAAPAMTIGQYGLELPPGFGASFISATAAWPPSVMNRLSPPTVTKVKPISIAFLA